MICNTQLLMKVSSVHVFLSCLSCGQIGSFAFEHQQFSFKSLQLDLNPKMVHKKQIIGCLLKTLVTLVLLNAICHNKFIALPE